MSLKQSRKEPMEEFYGIKGSLQMVEDFRGPAEGYVITIEKCVKRRWRGVREKGRLPEGLSFREEAKNAKVER